MPRHSTVIGWAQSDAMIIDDGSEDIENPTSIDSAIMAQRERLARALRDPAAGNNQGTKAPTDALESPVGGKDNKSVEGGGVSSLLFRDHYAHARVLGYEALADLIRDIADDSAGDVLENGRIDHENINRSRLRVDALKWILAKALPRRYGGDSLLISNEESRAPDVVLTGHDVDL